MPRSVSAGLVDIIALPGDLPDRMIAFLQHSALTRPALSSAESAAQSDLEKIVILLRDRSGTDFSLYKTNTLLRRIERRIALHQIDGTRANMYAICARIRTRSTCSSRNS